MVWDKAGKAVVDGVRAQTFSGPRRGARAAPALSRAGALQDSVGNQSVSRLLHAHRAAAIQAKLTMSRPNDHHELEADRAAAAVMSGAAAPVALTPWSPGIQRACTACEEEDLSVQRRAHGSADPAEEEEERLQAKADGASSAPASGRGAEARILAKHGGGEPLPASTRSFFEARFERDFSAVRVHADAASADLNRQLHAHAFTRGRDIFFAAGRFDPSSDRGKQLLAHELAHTLQQAGGPAAVQRQDDDAMPMGGMRSKATATCPGSKENKVYLTNQATSYAGVGHPHNVGSTSLRIMCYHADGNSIKGSSISLGPGDSLDWFHPVEGTAYIGFFCESGSGTATLAYDTPYA